MISSLSKASLCGGICLALMACGGGSTSGGSAGGGSNGGGANTGPVIGAAGYEYKGLDTTQNATLPLGGSAIRNGPTGLDTTTVSGSMDRPTGQLVISDPNHQLTDMDGVNTQGVATGTDGTTFTTRNDTALGGYEYLTVGNLDYVTANGSTSAVVVIGAVTQPVDMPITGQATYQGSAVVDEFSPNCQCRHVGSSTVVADFGTGIVNVTMGDFTSTSGTTALPVTQNFDTIILADMSINGTGFSGNTVITQLNGTTVTLYGSGATSSVNGTFYGLDHAGNPDEVGGVFLVDGNGAVMGVFVAD